MEEQNHRQRSRITELKISKGLIVNMQHVYKSRLQGTSIGPDEDKDLFKDLKAANQTQEQIEEYRRRHQWDGDVDQTMPAGAAVNRRRLIQIFRDAL